MKHTYTAKAFIDGKYESVEGLKAGRCVPLLTQGDGSYWIKEGHIHIGDATVTVELFDDKTIHAKQLDGLNTQLQAVRAENQKRENAILDQISKLTCLTHEESV